jgi:hypothetical protein
MSLERLLALVPRFRNHLERLFHPSVNEEPKPTVQFVNPTNGPMVLDDQCPTISVLIQGEQIHDVIIDGGSGVNVISKTTCDHLRITKWDKCPFWLGIVDTSAVRPLGLINDLIIHVGGFQFHIFAVVLDLESKGDYPLLLGRPWLQTARIKQDWPKNQVLC